MKKIINKIFIVGITGSGKSTFSEKLSHISKIPRYDLDWIYFVKGSFTKKVSIAKRRKKLIEILNKRKWIIDGVYTTWTQDIFKKANLIIWLNPPFRILSLRIITRYIKKKIKRQCGEDETLKSTLNLVKVASKYNIKGTRKYCKYEVLINKHKANFVVLKNNREINNFLKNFK